MNTNKHKNYLVIKNVCSDKNLVSYLEQICQDENVSILYEEFNQFDIWNQKQSVYANFNAKNDSDMLLWSYDSVKLEYINYLYKDFEARYRNTGNVVNRIIEKVSNFDKDEKVDRDMRKDLSPEYVIYNGKVGGTYWMNTNSTWTSSNSCVKSKKETFFKIFKDKLFNFYENWSYEIYSFLGGFIICYIFFITLLTLKYFVVK